MSLPVLLVASLTVLVVAFLAGRGGGRRAAAVRSIAAILLTPLAAEALLALRPEPTWASPPPWSPRGLEPVEGHRVPADLGAVPSEATTVVVMGDSFAAGQGVAEADAFPRLLDRLLTDDGHDVRVRLVAVPGWGFPDELLAYDALAAPLRPDVVVWTFVLNDLGLGRLSQGVHDLVLEPPPERSGSRLLDAWRRARHAAEVDAASERMYRDALGTDQPAVAAFATDLAALVDEAHGRGARFVLAIFPLLDRLDAYRFADEHARLRAIGEGAGAEVVDLLDAFRSRDEARLWASPLDHHPNVAGHRLAAEALRAALEAGPLRPAGPVRCDRLPVPDPALASPVRAACATPDAAAALALGDALLAAHGGHGVPFAAHLGVVAAHRAPGDPHVADHAADLVRRGLGPDTAARSR